MNRPSPPRTDAIDAILVADPDHQPIRGGCDDCLATRAATTHPGGVIVVRTTHDPGCLSAPPADHPCHLTEGA